MGDKKHTSTYHHGAKHPAVKSLKTVHRKVLGAHPEVLQYARAIRDLKARIALVKLEKKAYDEKYVMTDVKGSAVDPFSDKLRILQMDVDAQLAALNAVFGKMNNYEVELTAALNYPSTVTTGVVSGALSLTAAGFADFTALSGVFEEYKILKGHYRFAMGCELASASTTPANVGVIGMSMGYSINNTAYGSTAAAADDELAKVFAPVAINAAGRFLIEPKAGYYDYKFGIQPGVLSGTGVVNAGTYLPTSDSTTPWGYLKVYTICATATVTANAVNGILKMKFHFRNRI
jgi:hypothetical protein